MTEKRNFADWLSKFRGSIANYGYYIDFDKVYRNVNDIKVTSMLLIIRLSPVLIISVGRYTGMSI